MLIDVEQLMIEEKKSKTNKLLGLYKEELDKKKLPAEINRIRASIRQN